jgi:hypothetical protein
MTVWWRDIVTRRFTAYSALSIAAVLAAGLIALSAQPSTHLDSNNAQPGHRAVLVELFTSEGCSSCPSADALLQQVNGRYSDSGQLIVGVSEHVTYWNSLGWSDPFSSPTYTERQNAYGQRFHLDSVYTPQMVINGQEQIVGSNSAGLLRAIRKEDQMSQMDVHIASASLDGNILTLDFSVSGTIPGKGADIYAILADDKTSSNVLRGENSGRTLSHVSVARTITRVANLQEATELTIRLPLAGYIQQSSHLGRHLILFAQAPGFGQVLGVDTLSL